MLSHAKKCDYHTSVEGNPDVIRALQAAIASEGQLNAQYRLDWRVLGFMGIDKIADKFDGYGDDAHTWLKLVTDRCLLLGGDASYEGARYEQHADLVGALNAAHDLEMGILEPYEKAIQVCMEALDDATRNLFEHLIKWHQKHVAWIEKQLRLIDGLTVETYTAEKL